MPEFRKGSRERSKKPVDEPEGLDAFAAGATNVVHMPEREQPRAGGPAESNRLVSMTVAFDAQETAVLREEAARQRRSMRWLVRELMQPVLQELRSQQEL